jgi:hypothetical protein
MDVNPENRHCDGNGKIVQFAPENMMANLIFLLAHHPAMPVKRRGAQNFLATSAGQRMIIKPMVVLLDALSSLTHDRTTNAGLLYALLNKIRCSADALDELSYNVHMVGEICQLLMKQRLKVSADSLEFPGVVVLPKVFVPLGGLDNRSRNKKVSVGANSVEKMARKGMSTPDSRVQSPGLSPVPQSMSSRRRASIAAKVKVLNSPHTPAKKKRIRGIVLSPHESVLPAGFEIKICGRDVSHQPQGNNTHQSGRASVTPKAKKAKNRAITLKVSSNKNAFATTADSEPKRKQPRRATRMQANVSYADVDSELED